MGRDLCRLPADDRRAMTNRRGRAFLGLVLGWLVLDQLTKAAIVASLAPPGSRWVPIVPPWLDLTLTYNPGAAFGLLHNVAWSRVLFIVVATGALLAMVRWRRSLLALPTPQRVGLALVAAGAAGNLVDRIVRGGLVVDFIHFHIDKLNFVWPDFNVADIGVTCGMTLYVVHSIMSDLAARHDEPVVECRDEPADAG